MRRQINATIMARTSKYLVIPVNKEYVLRVKNCVNVSGSKITGTLDAMIVSAISKVHLKSAMVWMMTVTARVMKG